MKDEWRCARVDSGGLCVMIYGDLQMLVLYAGSLATQDTVSHFQHIVYFVALVDS